MKIYEIKLQYTVLRMGDEVVLNTPDTVVKYMSDAFEGDPTVEWLYVIPVDFSHHPIGRVLVSRGVATSTSVRPAEVFKSALVGGASGIFLIHNHPSGNPRPSQADRNITSQLASCGRILDIALIDHIIIGDSSDPNGKGYFSFEDAGELVIRVQDQIEYGANRKLK